MKFHNPQYHYLLLVALIVFNSNSFSAFLAIKLAASCHSFLLVSAGEHCNGATKYVCTERKGSSHVSRGQTLSLLLLVPPLTWQVTSLSNTLALKLSIDLASSYGAQCVTIPKIWTKPNPKLFYWYRILYFFQCQIFSDTESDTFFIPNTENGKVLKPRSFETETSHSEGAICTRDCRLPKSSLH